VALVINHLLYGAGRGAPSDYQKQSQTSYKKQSREKEQS
jgi:hypothetical protein